MKINVFKIPSQSIEILKLKFESLEMLAKHSATIDGWECVFYLSSKPEVDEIPWVKDYQGIVTELADVKNVIHYAVYLCSKGEHHFALTYGKSHFYVRNFCDLEFGLEMAKRIADENDVKQKATKRFSGKKKKEIKSFVKNTKLDNESGESVDYLNASVIEEKQDEFGEKSKFGSSIILSKEDLEVSGITKVLDSIVKTLTTEVTRFDLPKTKEIKDEARILRYDTDLLNQIKNDFATLETNDASYDLVGTDFIFAANEKYNFFLGRNKSPDFLALSHIELKKFIDTYSISDEKIFSISVAIKNDNQKTYSKALYEMIEYAVPNENVILENGKWKEFNEEYINQINSSIDAIEVENTEDEFKEIAITETAFNKSTEVSSAGYINLDQDLTVITLGRGHKIEAWDLQKGKTVYAVKFGESQKLVQVCNQAVTTLEVIRNNANLKQLNNTPERFCLWMAFKLKNVPHRISEVRSLALKQHIDMFAQLCRSSGIKPVLKISRKK